MPISDSDDEQTYSDSAIGETATQPLQHTGAKRNERAKHWCITLQLGGDPRGGDDRDPALLARLAGWKDFCDSIELRNGQYTYQYEVGKQGKYHIQAYIGLKERVYFSQIKDKLPTAHIEIARNVKNSIAYCSKEDTRLEDTLPICFPDDLISNHTSQGKRTDIAEMRESIKRHKGDLTKVEQECGDTLVRYINGARALAEFADTARPSDCATHLVWLQGPSGFGKTTGAELWASSTFGEDEPYVLSRKSTGTWFNQYRRQRVILIDEPEHGDGRRGMRIETDILHGILKSGSFLLSVAGSQVQCQATIVIICTNKGPDELYGPSVDRDRLQRRINEPTSFRFTPEDIRYLESRPMPRRGYIVRKMLDDWWTAVPKQRENPQDFAREEDDEYDAWRGGRQ